LIKRIEIVYRIINSKFYLIGITFLFLSLILLAEVNSSRQEIEIKRNLKNEKIFNIKQEIDKIILTSGLKDTKYGIAVYSIDEKEYYYQRNIDALLTPASNTKLFTTFSALYTLGDEYDIITTIYSDGKIIEGVLKGNLYIYGRGDGLMSVNDIEILATKMSNLGIRKIDGNIYADDSYFESTTKRQEYSNDMDEVEPLPPVTSLTIERNTATIIAKGVSSGVEVFSIPRSESFIFENNVRLAYNENIKLKDYNKRDNYVYQDNQNRLGDAPPVPKKKNRTSIKINSVKMKDCKQKFVISGYLKLGQIYAYKYFIDCPALAVAGALKYALINKGIEVKGAIDTKHNTNKAKYNVIAEFRRPLMELINICNKESDNFLAENIFKIVGAYAGDNINTSNKSRAVKRLIYDSLGIDFKNCQINDGSGLSRRNLVTTRALIATLIKSQYLPFADKFYNSLAVAGTDGTLYKRMIGTAAEKNVVAKTGTLRNVSSLAGYVYTRDEELLAFSMIFNGPYVYNYKALENKIAIFLANLNLSAN
jgi:PBP4 family serine-type D-alanyl-D-alanine carboxypeptidase